MIRRSSRRRQGGLTPDAREAQLGHALVAEAVDPDLVTLRGNPASEVGLRERAVGPHEEGGGRAALGQELEDSGRDPRIGTVVEGHREERRRRGHGLDGSEHAPGDQRGGQRLAPRTSGPGVSTRIGGANCSPAGTARPRFGAVAALCTMF